MKQCGYPVVLRFLLTFFNILLRAVLLSVHLYYSIHSYLCQVYTITIQISDIILKNILNFRKFSLDMIIVNLVIFGQIVSICPYLRRLYQFAQKWQDCINLAKIREIV